MVIIAYINEKIPHAGKTLSWLVKTRCQIYLYCQSWKTSSYCLEHTSMHSLPIYLFLPLIFSVSFFSPKLIKGCHIPLWEHTFTKSLYLKWLHSVLLIVGIFFKIFVQHFPLRCFTLQINFTVWITVINSFNLLKIQDRKNK